MHLCVPNPVRGKSSPAFKRPYRQPSHFVIAVLLGCVLLGGLTACNVASAGSANSGSPPAATVVSATDLGTLPTNADILGRDEAYSTNFQGHSVWLYGDTALQKPDASGRTFLSNTWSYTDDFNAANGISGFQERPDIVGSPSMLIQETPEENTFNLQHYGDNCPAHDSQCGYRWAIWPSSITTDPASDQAYVFYTVQYIDSVGNFKGQGASVATWQSFGSLPGRPSFNPPFVADHPDLMFGQSEPSYGSANLISNSTLYVYGCGEDTNGLDKGCRIARVKPATTLDKSTWTFYAGNGQWSSSDVNAVPVFDGLDILSVSWNEYLQQYVAVYASLFSNNVMIRISPNPEGPWSDETLAFTAMGNADGSNIYDAQAHSEYDSNGGQVIYITYSHSLQSGSEVRLVAVQLQKSAQQ
jgi:hypothetical protein